MAKELSMKQQYASIRAVRQFTGNRQSWMTKADVAVHKKGVGEIYHDTDTSIIVKYRSNPGDQIVDIMWETDFRELGLYGSYYTAYTKMTYKSDNLVIHSGDIKIFVVALGSQTFD